MTALNTLNHFDFWSAVPLDGTATTAEIARHTNLPREVVARVLDHAKTLRLFTDSSDDPDAVRHTSRSAALAKNAGLRALVSTILSDAGPPMAVMPQALEKYNVGQETLPEDMSRTAFYMFHGGRYANSWEYIENDGEGDRKGWRSRNFTTFMGYLKDIFRLEQIVDGAYGWSEAGNLSVVDVSLEHTLISATLEPVPCFANIPQLGGSAGHDAFALAKKNSNLKITVCDLPEVQSVFDKSVPGDLKSRVSFLAHDFFKPMPVQADLYLIKLILHDWPDKECVEILRALRPALKPGARVLFIDYVGKQDTVEQGQGGGDDAAPKGADAGEGGRTGEEKVEGEGLPLSIKQMGTSTDLRMMALFGTKERAPSAWKRLFREADERYDIVRFEANPLSFFAILEVVWRG